jgi:hypothetical protein
MGLDMKLYAVEDPDLILDEEETPYEVWVSLKSWYWRKANAIHQWFVANVQNEEDDCGVYEVSHDQLKRLTVDVNWVLMFPEEAEDYLPTQAGFFFGSQEYDQYYMDDLRTSAKYLKEALLLKEKNPDTRFFYCASW